MITIQLTWESRYQAISFLGDPWWSQLKMNKNELPNVSLHHHFFQLTFSTTANQSTRPGSAVLSKIQVNGVDSIQADLLHRSPARQWNIQNLNTFGAFLKWWFLKDGWFIVEHPIKMDDWGYPHFRTPPYHHAIEKHASLQHPYFDMICDAIYHREKQATVLATTTPTLWPNTPHICSLRSCPVMY